MAEVFTSLLLIVAVAFVAPLISWTIPKRLVPEVVLLILGGMLIGPHGLGLAVDDSSIELLRELGVAFLFLMAGYEIDINELRGAGGATPPSPGCSRWGCLRRGQRHPG